MEQYGWSLTEVKNQPYFRLLDILNTDYETEKAEQEEQKVYTGTDLKFLFGG
ncbi:hypothetical protein [Staphylococcus gallinarum]|uniref:Putative gp49 n=1 Tax=Staphylococcus gallinarum TaxID=1293 RepID=A0A0D0SKB8_STAGA|nr:hypothetical protein [Staphylococcus gallinarum]KIR10678.1 phage protein [Staphylococcus gallinarum]GEQ04571.1 hypothetical protein SGA02_03990 [Staphylococcus gallinarum]SUM32136.1 putative gp49 [Staphylococcus gallinarum]